jgi:predicted SnoaL-like aldol condensation-catalyzing enzyme
MKPETHSHKNAAVEFVRLVGAGKLREAYDRHTDGKFRHHNAFFRGDRASLLQAMEDNARISPHKVLEVKHALEDGDIVAVHSHIRQHPQDRGVAAVHLFRFEGGRIAEFWDISQAIPADSPNENGMF